MNKKDLMIVALLVACIPAWLFVDRKFIAPKVVPPVPVEQSNAGEEGAATKAEPEAAAEAATTEKKIAEPAQPLAEEITASLKNEDIVLELSSFGAGVKSVTLRKYPKLNEKDSPPVRLNFSDAHALAYEGIAGISGRDPLDMRMDESGKSVTFTKGWESGRLFERTITMGEGYMLKVEDRFVNQGNEPWTLDSFRILTGWMKNPEDMAEQRGVPILGVDSFTASDGLRYWGKELTGLYKDAGKPLALNVTPEEMRGEPVKWVSAKNKFFTQILRPTETVATMAVLSHAEKDGKHVIPKDIAAALVFPDETVAPGGDFSVVYDYFVGPKKYSVLKAAGNEMEGVMEFRTVGFWGGWNIVMEPTRKALLWTLNVLNNLFHSYGVAIIMLTVLVRILFWPLTHKSTESMKRMQEIQPQIKALQEKYKKDPTRMQQETMKLYKEHKVNPMGGCLPMFIQMPVMLALFTVLRNAIELRYAGFLWVSDLSAPENLFAPNFPIVGALNILPLLMAGSMIWQQKLTPHAAATPEQQQQQKMMMFMMPVMMLVFFYKMPSGLVLYWTTSQLLMILQMSLRNMKKKKAEA